MTGTHVRRLLLGNESTSVLDRRAALLLFQSHRASLIGFARRITGSENLAEDIVQDAWLRFDQAVGKATVQEPLHYLYRIVRNLAFDGRRRSLIEAERYGVELSDVVETVAGDRPSPEEEALARNELDFIQSVLRELPDRTRIAVEMHRFGGHTLTEIATRLKISVGTAHALVAEGVKHCHRRRTGG